MSECVVDSHNNKTNYQQLFARKRRARRFALQALYAMHMSIRPAAEVVAEFESSFDMHKADLDYFNLLVSAVGQHKDVLDEYILSCADRALSALTPVELCILRLSGYELLYQLEIPFKVVINESVDLARKYGAEQSYRYINGVLDRMATQVRAAEVDASISTTASTV